MNGDCHLNCLGEIALTYDSGNGGRPNFVLAPTTREDRDWCRLAAIGIEADFCPQTNFFLLENILIMEALFSLHPQNRFCRIDDSEFVLLDAFLRTYCCRDNRGAYLLHRGAVYVREFDGSFYFSFGPMGR